MNDIQIRYINVAYKHTEMEDATFGNAFRNKLIYKQKKYKEN